jgi:Cu-Zn family superoxide dismutase
MLMRRVVAPLLWAVLMGQALAETQGVVTIRAPLIGVKGDTIGQVVVRGSANATLARITVAPGGLTPGWHGVHFHMVGDCSDIGQFMLAKGHINHLAKNHGFLNPEGPDEGDLPNIYVNPDGSANAEMSSHAVRLLGQTGLIEGDGSALIITENEDDHMSQPGGKSGARVACAVLKS